MSPSEWVPIRWSSGPLEVATRKNVGSEEKEALLAWHEPAALRVVEGSPFNCLIVSLAAGHAEDATQQRTLKPLVDAAKAKGLTVLGHVKGKADAAAAARSLGLAGVVGEAAPAVTGLAAIADADWPSVRVSESGSTESGPTGYPWVDANGWRIQLARAMKPGATVWTLAEPKRTGAPVRPGQYAVAVADSGAYGGRWAVALDAITQGGLLKGTSESREAWSTIVGAMKFFGAHKDWTSLAPMAHIGITSSFAGSDEFLALEYLNLAARRQLPYRIIPSNKLTPGACQGLRAVVVIGESADRKALGQYLAGGGMVIVQPGETATALKAGTSAGTHETGYALYKSGKGTVAVSPEEWSDPYMVAQDAHRLVGRRHDVVRLWNAGSGITYPTTGAQRTVAHVVNYTGRAVTQLMTLYVARSHARARFYDLSGKVEPLKTDKKNEGTEVPLPVFTSYAAIEFGENT